jgi:hypothetical protein
MPPRLNAWIKIHKPGNPIRPVINNKNAPMYKIAKNLNNILKQQLQMENQYNTQNSEKPSTQHRDNKNKWKPQNDNIWHIRPTCKYTLKITEQQLMKGNDKHKTKQIITILHTILKQNYFEYQDTIYHPSKGVAMGSPISGTIAEIFLQHIENKHIKQLLDSKIINLLHQIRRWHFHNLWQ